MSRTRGSSRPEVPRVRRARPSGWHRASEGLIDFVLWSLGVLGLLSLIAAGVAHFWGLSIVLFSTGSMSPTIPAGSAALVQRIPGSQIVVGDVVTVERADALPVTHRVTSVRPAETPGEYIITMRGDANPAEDANPYQVREVRRVLYSVPEVATSIARLRDPRLIAGMTLVAGVLVTWAFWPRRGSRPTRLVEEEAESTDEAAGPVEPAAALPGEVAIGSDPTIDPEASAPVTK